MVEHDSHRNDVAERLTRSDVAHRRFMNDHHREHACGGAHVVGMYGVAQGGGSAYTGAHAAAHGARGAGEAYGRAGAYAVHGAPYAAHQ